MRTNVFLRGKESVQALNLLTNVFTVVLFVFYSIIKRTGAPDAVVYLLIALFLINLLLSFYALYLNNKHKDSVSGHRKNNAWITVRVVANLGLAVLSFFLLK